MQKKFQSQFKILLYTGKWLKYKYYVIILNLDYLYICCLQVVISYKLGYLYKLSVLWHNFLSPDDTSSSSIITIQFDVFLTHLDTTILY